MSDLHEYMLPIAQPLAKEYISGNKEIIELLYGYYAGNKEDWSKRARKLDEMEHLRANANQLADVIMQYNQSFLLTDEMIKNIEHIRKGAKVIIGGQQAGLWTGPLLVIHKAVSIIQAAKQASLQLGEEVVPVFWIAGEDHDWDEANHAYIISAEQQLTRLTMSRDTQLKTSVSQTIISNDQWQEAIAELDQALPSSEFKEGLLNKLTAYAQSSSSLTEMFTFILSDLFGQYGLLFIDSDYEPLRKLEQPMFEKLLEHNHALSDAYEKSAEKVKQLGFTPQVEFQKESANLFVFNVQERMARTLLYKSRDGYTDKKGYLNFSKQDIEGMLSTSPQLFSNNVLTRPLMQDYLFPVLGTVLGPGEIAYWALTKEAFTVLDMEMPIIVPRMFFTLVEGINAKNMNKYEFSFSDVMERFADKKASWLSAQDELHIAERFEQAKDEFLQLYEPLVQLAGSIQPGLLKLGETNMNKIIEQIQYFQNKTIDAQQKQFEAAIRQMDRIELSLKPQGKPQERALSMISYWSRYNRSWLDELFEAPYKLTGGHQIVNL